jgi:hypothetical protein
MMKPHPRPIVRRVLGKDFYCLPDQSAPDIDIASLEKRRCNALLSRFCRFERGLDAFAGVGVSSRYWTICTKDLYLVEKRPAALRLLRRNLPCIKRRGCRVHLVAGTAQDFLQTAIDQRLRFELIDCDPFGNCYELLPLVAQAVTKGVVCVTTGEIFQVYRGLNRLPGRPSADNFRGHKAAQWVTDALIPELVSVFENAKPVHYYVYPTSVRVILALGGFPVPIQEFIKRPRFLGWFGTG